MEEIYKKYAATTPKAAKAPEAAKEAAPLVLAGGVTLGEVLLPVAVVVIEVEAVTEVETDEVKVVDSVLVVEAEVEADSGTL